MNGFEEYDSRSPVEKLGKMLEEDDEEDGIKQPKIKYSEKLRRIKEIEAYPNVLNSTNPDIVLDITMKYIDIHVKEEAFE